MKFKAAFSVLMIAVLVLLSGCNEKPRTVDTENPFFELVSVPDIAPAEREASPLGRVNDTYTEKFIARSDYGELLPYTADELLFTTTDKKSEAAPFYRTMYGLCTADGRIVTDAVYGDIKRINGDGISLYELSLNSDGTNGKTTQKVLIRSDGAWALTLLKNACCINASGGLIQIKTVKYSGKRKLNYYNFYDYNGKWVFTYDQSVSEAENIELSIGGFKALVSAVNITESHYDEETKETTYTTSAYYMDMAGNYANAATFLWCGDFTDGYAVVQDENGYFGVINEKFEYFLEPRYKGIEYYPKQKLFSCLNEGYFELLDFEKKQVKKVFGESGTLEICDSDSFIVEKISAVTGKSEFILPDGNDLTCLETGQFPDKRCAVNGLFICTYNNTATVFTEDGKTLKRVQGLGKFAYSYNNKNVMMSSDGMKISAIDKETGTAYPWTNGEFYGSKSGSGRYCVIRNNADGKYRYSVYDIETGTCPLTNLYYAEFFDGSDTLAVTAEKYYGVLDGELNTLMKYTYDFGY